MTLAMDNWSFDVTGWRGHLDWNLLEAVLRVAFADINKVTHFNVLPQQEEWGEPGQRKKIVHPPRLQLWWIMGTVPPGLVPLLGDLDYKKATIMVETWLEDIAYPPQPDHDGDNSKGWRVHSGERGGHYPRPVCVVEPAWAEHGK